MELLTLQSGPLRLSIAPHLGAGVADFSLRGPGNYFFPLMRRAAPDETNASLLGSFFMAPWVNRIRAGKFNFGGRDYALTTNTPDGMAQHGDVRKRPWTVISPPTNPERQRAGVTSAASPSPDHSLTSATLEFDSRTQENINWPWPFLCRAVYSLSSTPTGGTLRIDLSIRNLSPNPFPAACGHHPYFMRRLFSDLDDLHLSLPVHSHYPLENGCAIAPPTPDALTTRLQTLAPLPKEPIDSVFSCLPLPPSGPPLPLGEGRGEGFPPSLPASSPSSTSSSPSPPSSPSSSSSPPTPNTAELHWPASRVRLRINASPNMTHWVLYAPHEDPNRESPLAFIAVEPQTQVNDALNLATRLGPQSMPLSRTGTIILQPNEELTTWCEFQVATHRSEAGFTQSTPSRLSGRRSGRQ